MQMLRALIFLEESNRIETLNMYTTQVNEIELKTISIGSTIDYNSVANSFVEIDSFIKFIIY